MSIRTFRAAVGGSFFTRLGIGGIPFLFPLLVGLGFTPIQSGLLMMPQALAATSLKLPMPGILSRFGYPRRAGFQHGDAGPDDRAFYNHRSRYAGVADRAAGVLFRFSHLAAMYQHEHAGLCRRHRRTDQQRQHHPEHPAADVDQFRRRLGIAGRRRVRSRPLSFQLRRRNGGSGLRSDSMTG